MEFQKLIQNLTSELPIKQTPNEQFNYFIQKLFKKFLKKVNNITERDLSIPGIHVSAEFVKSNLKRITDGLTEAIEEYYKGHPFNAYRVLDNTLQHSDKNLADIFKQKRYQVGENFYRVRLKEENFPFEAKDLFHIPFQLRGKVSTQRYSIPGFPSLYLGRTLYICWEEMNRPKIDSFQAMRLENNREIKCLDLTPPPPSNGEVTQEHYRYLMTWPLIACCSVKVKDYTDTFKPEYIIPQLLLQWVRSNQEIDGICYKSTHIAPELYAQDGELTNVVLPVRKSAAEGHCPELKNMFKTTEVISWQLYEYALGGQEFIHWSNEFKEINKRLPNLELIRGRTYPYSYSILGKLEHYLDNMETKPLL